MVLVASRANPQPKAVRAPVKAVAPHLRAFVVAPRIAGQFSAFRWRNVFEAQVVLARRAISSGSIAPPLGCAKRAGQFSVFRKLNICR